MDTTLLHTHTTLCALDVGGKGSYALVVGPHKVKFQTNGPNPNLYSLIIYNGVTKKFTQFAEFYRSSAEAMDQARKQLEFISNASS